ncbi:transcription-repair coupling factor [bacterium]|nr:transcription-repair coupling factor [bacterium]
MTNTIIKKLSDYFHYNQLFTRLSENSVLDIKGLYGSSKVLFMQELLETGPGLVIMPEENRAEQLADEAMQLLGDESVALFPAWEDRTMPATLNPRQAGMRMEVLRDLLSHELNLVITSAEALCQPLPDPDAMRQNRIDLRPGSRISLTALMKRLIEFGYTREPVVERPGEVCLRGGILDIFPYTGECPHRIEFFGDDVESIRSFDLASQRSTGRTDALHLIASPDTWAPAESTLLDYVDTAFWIFIEDRSLFDRPFSGQAGEHDFQKRAMTRLDDARAAHRTVLHHTISSAPETVQLNILPIPPLGRSPSVIRQQIGKWLKNSMVCLMCDQPVQVQRMVDFLDTEENPMQNFHVMHGPIKSGFQLPSASLVIITQADLFGPMIYRRRPKKRFVVKAEPIREMSALTNGDYVVHIDHGIGIYQGLEKIVVAESERECLSIRYQDGDMLYVPVEKMERVQKYAGRESVLPEVSKLGSPQWDRVKERTKKSVEKIARELILLYSVRQSRPGLASAPDTPWQRELEASFVYEETPDQAAAIQDVKNDMEKPVPMDRLICGDVGYGKTEVAVRAAFKAVNAGYQVALLAPTTILAQQHHQTFCERLSPFPVRIDMLSRFRSKKEQADIVNLMKTGSVDIVIGTHRLLSGDVGFKNLGLLIIDEEQKFGVRHKERLKAFRETVDVLALSATPIPRTLNLSLVGIRDMSVINTPPRDRLPIHTEVLPFDESIVAEAMHRELNREGQIFFVHNRIQSIHAVARMVERIVPGARIAIAHGQMHEHDLEKIMVEFTEHKYDCLVATMIVGSGLDMPHVNTLLVNRADRLGLSQLYQLRGRVGRSNQKAYAYLFTPPVHQLKPEAIKRLRTIEEFTELGAGFQIAMKDLEIRGAGNLLGYQQSGYMDAVGFELYTRLVAEAVEELKEASDMHTPAVRPVACQAQIDEDAYFPDSYIDDDNLRLNLYRRLAGIQSETALDDFAEELKDRFGPPPVSALNLLSLFHLQLTGRDRQIMQIRIEGNKLRLFFDPSFPDRFENPDQLSRFLRGISENSKMPVRFLTSHGLGIEMKLPEDRLSFTKKWLQSWG